jgi:hypothetical protein
MEKLLAFIQRLDEAGIHHSLLSSRADAILIDAHVPGQRWEIEFFADGHVEIERFYSDPEGVLDDEALLDVLIEEYRD